MKTHLFSFQASPYIFEWRQGSKTVNIYSKDDGLREKCLSNVSFGHEKAKTTMRDAKKSIQHWRNDNE